MNAGYSPRPLWQKLGIKPGMRAHQQNAPAAYHDSLLDGAPDARWQDGPEDADFIHIFVTERAVLSRALAQALAAMDRDGMIWVSWPKKSAKVPTDVTEDVIRAECLPMGLVDVKVCAVSEVWSGLKLMIRKELR